MRKDSNRTSDNTVPYDGLVVNPHDAIWVAASGSTRGLMTAVNAEGKMQKVPPKVCTFY